MKYVITGGTGYIGRQLATTLSQQESTERIHLLDIKEPNFPLPEKCLFSKRDVRASIPVCKDDSSADWIFNFAAIHREPGHGYEEYFDTNVPGAENVCRYADAIGCDNIYFTSSIAVYGPVNEPTREDSPKYPFSGYGISKLLAEKIHEKWQASRSERRLVICRPGVVYGPAEPGNIQRMIKAVRKGFFLFPGKKDIHKSYAYIDGLLDSIQFTMLRDDPLIRYNYVEHPTEPLYRLCDHIRDVFSVRGISFSVPLLLLVPIAKCVQIASAGKSGIHPTRVRKAASSTNIVPQWLIDNGFAFERTFKSTLLEWREAAPQDFDISQ